MKKKSSSTMHIASPHMTNKSAAIFPFLALFLLSIWGAMTKAEDALVKGGPINGADVAWMLTASALVLLMTPGLSFFYGGMVQPKNVISTMLQSFIAMGLISLLWVLVGFSLAFGDSINGVIGNPMTFLMFKGVGGTTHPDLSPTIPLALFALFQLKFAIITPALITGSFAERVRFSSYTLFLGLWSLVVYSPLAHMTWHPNGIFRKWGVLDFAGGTVVHLSAGVAALAAALILGRRKVHVDKTTVHPANIPYVILGTGMLWFGWFGFNAGSALAANESAVSAFLATNTACAAAMLAWILADVLMGRRPTALGGCIGAVVGLVAITPASGYVGVGPSIFIGTVAAFVCNFAAHLRSKSDVDDTLDVFPCHGVGGMMGMILTGVFAKDVGLVYGQTEMFKYQCLALVVAALYTFIASAILLKVTDAIIPIRVSGEQEDLGLDLSQHGEAVVRPSFAVVNGESMAA